MCVFADQQQSLECLEFWTGFMEPIKCGGRVTNSRGIRCLAVSNLWRGNKEVIGNVKTDQKLSTNVVLLSLIINNLRK